MAKTKGSNKCIPVSNLDFGVPLAPERLPLEVIRLEAEIRQLKTRIRHQIAAIQHIVDYFEEGLSTGQWGTYDQTQRMLSQWRGAIRYVGADPERALEKLYDRAFPHAENQGAHRRQLLQPTRRDRANAGPAHARPRAGVPLPYPGNGGKNRRARAPK